MFREKVVITQVDEKTVIAEWYHDGRRFIGEAKCSPEDEFDFAIGGNIALERVAEKINEYNKKKNLVNGKYVWIGTSKAGLTKGKIYNIVDGFFIDDDDDKRPDSGVAFTKKELDSSWFGKYFVALVE